MRLSADEYEAGLLSWNANRAIGIRTITSDEVAGPESISEVISDARPSKVSSKPGRLMAIRLEMTGPEPLELASFQVRWERLTDRVVQTAVWDKGLGRPTRVRHLPALGFYHRVVVEARDLDWTTDAILRSGGILVRFVTGDIEVERASDFSTMEPGEKDGEWVMGGAEQATTRVNGRFIDIAAPGASPSQAENRAFGVLGLLGFVLGGQAIGAIVSSEEYEVRPGRQDGRVRIGVKVKVPRALVDSEIDRVDVAVGRLDDSKAGRALELAFRSYERGLRSDIPVDRFVSFFLGIETIVSAFAAAHSPLPVEKERATALAPMLKLANEMGGSVGARARDRLIGVTLAERYDAYDDHHGLASKSEFRRLRDARNSLLHGDMAEFDDDLAVKAKELLVSILLRETGLADDDLLWKKVPEIHGMRISFGFGQGGTAA